MERIQRRSTKYILNNYTSDYKTRLLKLKLLPLMYLLDLSDVLFFIKSIKLPSDNFNILCIHFVSFSSSNALYHMRILYRTRTVYTIRVWYTPYAYGIMVYTIRV